MSLWARLGMGVVGVAAAAVMAGYVAYRSAMGKARDAYATLAAGATATQRFDSAQVAALPEIAQRYFRHAIAPGTPLYSAVEIEMGGTFLLGEKAKYQRYAMSALQVLKAPDHFVWIPHMRSGAMTVTGSDALVGGEAWTRFWLMGLVPVAQEHTSPDLVRSAQFRAAVESALSLPPSLLPERGSDWEQVGEHRAKVTLRGLTPAIELFLTLDERGAVREVVGQRWSNANRDKIFRLQPFGGTASADRTFQGLTIPTEIAAGNHYGTSDYLPFFQARIVKARYF